MGRPYYVVTTWSGVGGTNVSEKMYDSLSKAQSHFDRMKHVDSVKGLTIIDARGNIISQTGEQYDGKH